MSKVKVYANKRTLLSVILLFVLLIPIIFTVVSCKKDNSYRITSNIFLNSGFSGYKTITLIPEGNYEQVFEEIDKFLPDHCPSVLSYRKNIERDKPAYEFRLDFSSLKDYKEKLGVLSSNTHSVFFRVSNSIFSKGVNFKEDITSKEILSWIISPFNMNISQSKNTIYYDNKYIDTGEQMEMFSMKGEAIDHIYVDTSNNKDGTFNRKFCFEIPKSTIDNIGNDIDAYFSARVLDKSSADKQYDGNKTIFNFSFNNLSPEQLSLQTKLILNLQDDTELSYNDNLSVENLFEDKKCLHEELNFGAYCSGDDKPVPITYNYKLPDNSVIAHTSINNKEIKAENSKFEYSSNEPTVVFDITDGTELVPQTVQISLSRSNDKSYNKDFAFVYPTGSPGAEHVYKVLSKLTDEDNISVATEDQNLEVCHLSAKGDIDQINDVFSCLSEKNVMVYKQETSGLRLSNNISLIDTVDLSPVKNSQKCPSVDYTIYTDSMEFIENIKCVANSNTVYNKQVYDASQNITISLPMPTSDVEVGLKRANVVCLVIFLLFVALIFFAVIMVIRYLYKKNFAKCQGDTKCP